VRDLLQAHSGIYHAALYESPEMGALRPPRSEPVGMQDYQPFDGEYVIRPTAIASCPAI
jgi:hypothetical protein